MGTRLKYIHASGKLSKYFSQIWRFRKQWTLEKGKYMFGTVTFLEYELKLRVSAKILLTERLVLGRNQRQIGRNM